MGGQLWNPLFSNKIREVKGRGFSECFLSCLKNGNNYVGVDIYADAVNIILYYYFNGPIFYKKFYIYKFKKRSDGR
ncbi:hypothetical protein ACM40_00930 [Chryseobacterium sp. BLS98]|nr:hypothetical protein ACM40_00930 [Chryseobacterium sp. BLS98]